MSEVVSIPLIYKKISAVMTEITAIGKDRTNQQQGFKFRGIDDVYNELHDIMAKHGVFTVPTILDRKYRELQTSKGGVSIERILTIQYRFFCEDGSFVDTVVDGEARDSGDKTTSKCMAIAHKYALLQIFCIATEDSKEEGPKDPDMTSPDPLGKPPAATVRPNGFGNKTSESPLITAALSRLESLRIYMNFSKEWLSQILVEEFGTGNMNELSLDQLKKTIGFLQSQNEMKQNQTSTPPPQKSKDSAFDKFDQY